MSLWGRAVAGAVHADPGGDTESDAPIALPERMPGTSAENADLALSGVRLTPDYFEMLYRLDSRMR